MHKLSTLAAAVLGTALSVAAQTCTAAPGPTTFSNRTDFGASFYYNLGTHQFDLNVQVPISINWIKTWTYDQGAGNPVVPNQVGATGVVNVYTCPTTRLGNETNAPTNPGSPWTLLGSGTITVVATPGESQIVFAPALALPAGQYGVALEYLATTNGPNPGLLHCLGLSPNPGLPVSDQFMTMTNDGIQQTAWTGLPQDSANLRINYTPDANSALYQPLGEGCYFRPQAFYESFPASASTPDLANTSILMVYLGPNYLVAPGGATLVAPTSPSLTLNAPPASSSGNWDDALSVPITLPFVFNYPGGSTSVITIGSNGYIYLDSVASNSYDVCGASYGSIVPFRDNAPRLAAYFHDLDPDPTTGGGGIHYDVDPNGQFATITWLAVPEWPAPSGANTMQLTLHASGNVDIVYGTLSNAGVANGNNAIAGFTPGLGSRLGPAIDISAAINAPGAYTSGDGAIPPILSMDARPVIGTTPNLVTTNITPGTVLQVLAAGTTAVQPPLDLGIIGMPGCNLHVNFFVLLTNVINPNNTFTQPFAIPLDPTLQSAQFVFQAAPLTAGLNPMGIIISNGLCTRIGL